MIELQIQIKSEKDCIVFFQREHFSNTNTLYGLNYIYFITHCALWIPECANKHIQCFPLPPAVKLL